MNEKGDNDTQNESKSDGKKEGDNAIETDVAPNEGIEVSNIFDYLTPLDEDSIAFSFKINDIENNIENNIENKDEEAQNENIFKDMNENYKYVICILLKNNSNDYCKLLEKTLKGIIDDNLEGLSTLSIEEKNIKIFIFINQINLINNDTYLVNKNLLTKIDKKNNYLKIPQKFKDDNAHQEIKIDVICKKTKMTEIESLKCYYNYILSNFKKPVVSSIITAGVVPEKDSLKKMIQISFGAIKKTQEDKNRPKFSIAVPDLEINNEEKNFYIKIAQYDKIHYNIYDMNFYCETAAVPITSLLNTMIIDKSLMNNLTEYYTKIKANATIDYHDYNLALYLCKMNYKIDYYSDEIFGKINYSKKKYDFWDYRDAWVNKLSGHYGNFFEILRIFPNLQMAQKIFMIFQIIGLLIEFIYPSLSILVIYSVFYEAFCISDICPAVFMTLLYLLLYLGSGACSMITNSTEKMRTVNLFFFFSMEVYYLFILICSIPAMDNIKKGKEPILSSYKFNTGGCACLIIFTFLIAIIPIILKMSIITNYIPQMFIYLFIGAPSSTSNFLIAKIWKAPETPGGESIEEQKGITVIFFFLFNFFFGFLCFYNYTRKLRANCVMGLAIFYLLYLFFKVIGIVLPLLSGSKLNEKNEEKIKAVLSGEIKFDSSSHHNNSLKNSQEKLNQSHQDDNEEKLDEEEKNEEKNSENENKNKNNDSVDVNENKNDKEYNINEFNSNENRNKENEDNNENANEMGQNIDEINEDNAVNDNDAQNQNDNNNN